MLRTLLESNPPRQRRRASAIASLAIHTLAIAGAVVATASARPRASKPVDDSGLIFVPTARPAPGPREPSRGTQAQRAEPIPSPSAIAAKLDMQPVATPEVRRWIDLDPRALLAADTVSPGASWEGVRPGRRVLGADNQAIATLATVERPAGLLTALQPRYPEPLRVAGVTGRVVVRLVVDTAGRVEPASVAVLEASHDLFAQAVRAVLATLRFTPAVAGGRKVRMLIELPFEFRLHE